MTSTNLQHVVKLHPAPIERLQKLFEKDNDTADDLRKAQKIIIVSMTDSKSNTQVINLTWAGCESSEIVFMLEYAKLRILNI